MAISDIKTAIATAINTVLGVKCYTSIPSMIAELPCAFIRTADADYNITLPVGNLERILEISLLFARAEIGRAHV